MKLGFINEVMRGVWFLDETVQDHYAHLAFQHLESLAANRQTHHAATSSDADEVNQHLVVALGVRSGASYRMSDPTPTEPYIGIIAVEGVVRKYSYCGEMGTVTMQQLMQSNENDPQCIGHFLQIDSPGGSAANTETLARYIREDVQKPVVGWFNSMCASAAYYIGCAADELYASQADDSVGSIGVYCTLYDYSKYYEKNGVVKHEVYATQSAKKNDFVKEAFKGNYKPLQEEYLNPVAEQFLQTVNDMRPNLTDEKALQGKLYAAKNAPAGMIDGIMKFSEALNRVQVLAEMKQKN